MRLIILLFILINKTLFSQEINFNTYFIEDSVKIGDSITFISIMKYPKNIEIIQPDSSYNFSPFEFIEKKIFPSIIKDDFINDSIIYKLRTFEIDTIQSLFFNSYIINSYDSMIISSTADSVFLINQVTSTNEKIRYNTLYNKILNIFNTNKWLFIAITLLFSLLILYLIFRNKINNYFKILKLKNRMKKFSIAYKLSKDQYFKNSNKTNLEKLILLWKRFMERSTTKPYLSSTTKEICEFLSDDNIKNILNSIDKILYSNTEKKCDSKTLKSLHSEAIKISNEKILKIKNGT